MEGSFLSPQEKKYYSELFARYDAENTGKLTNNQALSLFVSSNVQTGQLKLISELCGAERVGHYGRSQFFIALKLIALVQSGKPLPTSIDNQSLGLEVPLPKFGEKADDQGINSGMQEFENPVFIGNAPETDFNGMNGSGLPPPPQISRGSVSGNVILQSINETDGSSPQDFSPSSSPSASPEPLLANASSPHQALAQEPVSPVGVARTTAAPVASTPLTNKGENSARRGGPSGPSHIGDEGWAEFDKSRSQDEHCGSLLFSAPNLPIDMDNSWAQFPVATEETEDDPAEKKKDEVDGPKGKEEDEDDPWVITKEQRKYYTQQFQNLQQDLALSIKGPDAKAFFEKSKLPTYELSQIWQLSDVNKDGTLYLEEFCTAMHLVVLRKHDISLPEKLPASLIPKLGNNEATPEAVPPSSAIVITPLNSRKHSGRSITPPSSESEVKSDENWATFQDSPFPGPASPSSQTPVNFNFASISPDPDAKIFQPIAVHMAPDGRPLAVGEQPTERPRTFSDPLHLERQSETTKQRSMTHADTTESTPNKIAPPPSIQKMRVNNTLHQEGQDLHEVIPPPPRSRSSEETHNRSYTGPTLRSQLQQFKSQSLTPLRLYRQQALTEESEGNRSLPVGTVEPVSPLAPAPPPRKSGHNRAASLDLNKMEELDRVTAVEPGRPSRPLIPPRPGAQNQQVDVQYTHTPKRAISMDERHSQQRTDKFQDSQSSFEVKTTESNEKEGPPQLPPRPPLPEELQQDIELQSPERHHSVDLDKDVKKAEKQDRRRHLSAPTSSSKKSKPKDRKAIQAAIRAAKEENVILSRHNNELHQELSQLTGDRVALEAQLQKLRPFHKINSS
ncbi:ralBP1-associated Eps domain-containing protein 1-like isoform X2 [Apostichopus japonicus]|uniref:ralBP1-associated Eps domain-containing protein 1-like isoform X2 n=1 Tax=Stichopus japonicus TaxID=307972 RepID=UPI003AB34666